MRISKFGGLLLSGLLLLSWGGAAQAQPPADAGSKAEAGGPIAEEDLPKMLQNMGYEAEKVDEGVYRVVIEQDSWTFYIRFSLSTDSKQRLWMTSSFGEIKDWQKMAPAPLMALLVANDRIGPAHFYVTVSGDVRRLNAARAVDNRGITPAILRRELDKFLTNIRDTAEQWDIEKWTAAGDASATPATAAPPSDTRPAGPDDRPVEAPAETPAPQPTAAAASTPVP